MAGCRAREIPRSEAYIFLRRRDQGGAPRLEIAVLRPPD